MRVYEIPGRVRLLKVEFQNLINIESDDKVKSIYLYLKI
jgi:hypothetical protein